MLSSGERLARLRKAKNMTQQDVADAAKARGWSFAQSTVSAFEKDARPLTPIRVLMLSVILDVPVKELVPTNMFEMFTEEGVVLLGVILERWGDYPRGRSIEEQQGFLREILIEAIEQVKSSNPEMVSSERRQRRRGPQWRKAQITTT